MLFLLLNKSLAQKSVFVLLSYMDRCRNNEYHSVPTLFSAIEMLQNMQKYSPVWNLIFVQEHFFPLHVILGAFEASWSCDVFDYLHKHKILIHLLYTCFQEAFQVVFYFPLVPTFLCCSFGTFKTCTMLKIMKFSLIVRKYTMIFGFFSRFCLFCEC